MHGVESDTVDGLVADRLPVPSSFVHVAVPATGLYVTEKTWPGTAAGRCRRVEAKQSL